MTDAPIDFDLRRRTPGERFWLARRAAGLSGPEAALRAGLGKNALYEAERGLRPVPGLREARLKPVRPGLPELLALARRRAGTGLGGLAEALGTSRVTALARERAGDPDLRGFWARKGFRFP